MPSLPPGISQSTFVSLCEASRMSCPPVQVVDAQNTTPFKMLSILPPVPLKKWSQDQAQA